MKKIVWVFLLFISACANFTSGTYKPVSEFAVAEYKPSIKVKVKSVKTVNSFPTYNQLSDTELFFTDKISERFERSKMFSKVSADVVNPDYELNLTVYDDGHVNRFFSTLTGFTLFIIPSWTTDNFKFDATLTDVRAKQSNRIVLQENYYTVSQLAMIFFYPFTQDKLFETYDIVIDNLAVRVHDQIKH